MRLAPRLGPKAIDSMAKDIGIRHKRASSGHWTSPSANTDVTSQQMYKRLSMIQE